MKGRKLSAKLFLSLFFLLAIAFSAFSATPPQIHAQSTWVFDHRERDCNVYYNSTNPGQIRLEFDSTPYVYDVANKIWVPLIFSSKLDSYTIQNGLIAVNITKGYASFYDVNFTECRVKREHWIVEQWRPTLKVWLPVLLSSQLTFDSWSVSQELSKCVNVTVNYANSFGTLTVKYVMRAGCALKHEVAFVAKVAGTYQLKQVHIGIAGDTVQNMAVTGDTTVNGWAFTFRNGNKLSLLESQWASTHFSNGTLRNKERFSRSILVSLNGTGFMATAYTFSNWTLATNAMLLVDPDTSTFQPSTKDSYINLYAPTTNYGTETNLKLYDYTGRAKRIIIHFDMSGLSDGITISSATLSLYKWTYDNSIDPQSECIVDRCTQTGWVETEVTWNNYKAGSAWSSAGGDYDGTNNTSINLPAYGNWATWTVTDQVIYAYNHVTKNAHFILRMANEARTAGNEGQSYFYSKEEGTQTTLRPKLIVTYTPANTAPVNGAGSITDMDDTNNLYAQKKLYTGSSVATDANGYADIHYMEFRLKQGATTRATFQYHEDDNTFNIQTGGTTWDLDASSSASRSGTQITVTWKFSPKWGATEESGLSIELYVIDAASASDTDTAQSNYCDVVKTLTVSGFASNPVTYVNPSSSITFSGTVYYVNNPASSTPSTSYPPDAEFTAVHIHNAAHASQGSDVTIVNGAFSLAVTSPATVGSYTYHPYIDMADADYTDADPSGITDGFTVEQVRVQSYTRSDDRANINANVNIDVTLQYASDSSAMTDGTITINGYSAIHQGSGVWRITRTSASVASATYDTVVASGNTRAITSVNQNSQSTIVIWDRIRIDSIGVVDGRIDIGVQGTFYATASLEYGGHTLGSGDSLTLGGYVFSWSVGNSRFEYSPTQASVIAITVNAFTSGNEATYSIIAGNINSQTGTIIWDRFEFVSISADDTRINVGGAFELRYQIRYDYDDVVFDNTKGSIAGFTWDAGNSWWEKTVTGSSSVTTVNYDENYVIITDTTYGLTAKQDVAGVNVTTDGLKLAGLTSPAFLGSGQYRYYVRITYAIDNSAIASGVVRLRHANGTELTINFVANSTGWATIDLTQPNSSAGTFTLHGYSEPGYGITYKHTNQTFTFYTLSLQGRDYAKTNLPRALTFKVTSGGSAVIDKASSSAALGSFYAPEASYAINTWWGTHLVNASLSYTLSATATVNVDTYIRRLDSSTKYALFSLNATALPAPGLIDASYGNWWIEAVTATGTVSFKLDHANWIATSAPETFYYGANSATSADPNWSYDSANRIFTFPVPFSTITLSMTWPAVSSPGPAGGPPGSTDYIPTVPVIPTPTVPTIPEITVPTVAVPNDLMMLGAIAIPVLLGVVIGYQKIEQRTSTPGRWNRRVELKFEPWPKRKARQVKWKRKPKFSQH